MTEPAAATGATGVTPSQTVGPFLHIGLTWPDGPYVVPEGTPGGFWITGALHDGAGAPIPDGIVETWQADPDGNFGHPDDPRPAARSGGGFRGFGRCATDEQGRYRILTVKPGPLPCPDGGLEAPHLNLSVFARGMQNRVVTRLYFPDEAAANAADPVLSSAPAERRHTLVAQQGDGELRFDIRIQGDGETVFFTL